MAVRHHRRRGDDDPRALAATRRDDYGADVLERLAQGERMTATQYLKGQQARRVLVERFRRCSSRSTCWSRRRPPILAPTISKSRGAEARRTLLGFTRLFNVLGLPAVVGAVRLLGERPADRASGRWAGVRRIDGAAGRPRLRAAGQTGTHGRPVLLTLVDSPIGRNDDGS